MRTLTAPARLLFATLLLLSCNRENDGNTVSADSKDLLNTNFDDFRGWVDNTVGSLSKQQSRSGQYSLTVGGGREYSLTFKYPLGELTTSKPRKLHLRAWIRVEEATTPAQLIVQVTKPDTDEQVFRRGISLFGGSDPGKWMKIETDLIMPEAIASDHILGIYMWANNAAKPVYLDDLRITNVE